MAHQSTTLTRFFTVYAVLHVGVARKYTAITPHMNLITYMYLNEIM